METVHRDFSPLKVKFYYVYKALAHPERDGLVQPSTLTDRLLHLKEAQRRLNTKWTWLTDAPDNQIKTAFGNRNNSEFVIDPKGNIVRARDWSDAAELRKDLIALVGKPETTTSVADLNLKQNLPSNRDTKIARNVLPRVEAPDGSAPLLVKSLGKEDAPRYLKLRVDADQDVIRNGTGKMRLGFWLDPLHRVHWNNLAVPLKFEIINEDFKEGTLTPSTASAPKVEVEADYDPREFLIDVKDADLSKPLKIKVSYFPCHDVDEWCRASTQVFEVSFKSDLHAGKTQSQMRRGRQGGGAGGPGAGRGGPQRGRGQGGMDPAQFIARMDTNKDGKISKEEAPERMAERFDQMDTNNDGFLTEEEIKKHFESRRTR